jgi:hypothetical protein
MQKKRAVKGLVAAVLLVFGILCFVNVVDVGALATVQFYEAFDPTIKSWNFPGTSTSPTIIPPGAFTPEVLVEMDTDTQVDMAASKCTIDGNNWAVYWDHSKSLGKVYTGSLVTNAGQKHHITFAIVFQRISSGSTTMLMADGYVQGGSVSGTWYLNSYNLNKLGDYEVLQIPYSGAVTLKFVASSGGEFVGSAYFKIWKHVLGRDVTQYESYPPDWTVVLNEVVADSTWSSSWTLPSAGTYVMYGYVTMSGKDYRQLSVIPTIGGGGFAVNQVIGVLSIAVACLVGWSARK